MAKGGGGTSENPASPASTGGFFFFQIDHMVFSVTARWWRLVLPPQRRSSSASAATAERQAAPHRSDSYQPPMQQRRLLMAAHTAVAALHASPSGMRLMFRSECTHLLFGQRLSICRPVCQSRMDPPTHPLPSALMTAPTSAYHHYVQKLVNYRTPADKALRRCRLRGRTLANVIAEFSGRQTSGRSSLVCRLAVICFPESLRYEYV